MRAAGALVVVLVLAAACARDGGSAAPPAPHRDSKGSNMSTPELEIVVDATYKLTMGWGNVWAATVREVKVGALADRELQLSLMDDPEGALYGGRFKDLGPQRGVTLRLRRVDRRPAALVGFVAGDGTIWQVESAR